MRLGHLLLLGLIIPLGMPAHGNSLLPERDSPLYQKNSSVSLNDNSQRRHIEEMEREAQKNSDATLELAALNRLALISGTNSQEYRIALIRHKLKLGGKDRKEAKELIDRLCTARADAFECVQGQALYEITSQEMRLKLQSFSMYEKNQDYEHAVEALDEIFKGRPPKEHNLAMRYYAMMGNIEGREEEALSGLETIYREEPENSPLQLRIKSVMASLSVSYEATKAFALMATKGKRKEGIEKLTRLIKDHPQHDDIEYYKRRLKESLFYEKLAMAETYYKQGKISQAIKTYNEASQMFADSPYADTALANIYAQRGDEKNFKIYSARALLRLTHESPAEKRRISMSLKSLNADLLKSRAQKHEAKYEYARAIALREQALRLYNAEAWDYYALSSDYISTGDHHKALLVFEKLPKKLLYSKDFLYPYALILDKTGNEESALSLLKLHQHKDPRLKEMYERLRLAKLRQSVNELLDSGKNQEAMKAAEELPKKDASIIFARISEEQKDYVKADAFYDEAVRLNPEDKGLLLDYAFNRIRLLDYETAKSTARAMSQDLESLSLNEKMSLIAVYEALEDYENARKINAAVIEELSSNNAISPSPDGSASSNRQLARFYRNAGRFNHLSHNDGPDNLENYKKALALLNNRATPYENDAIFTHDLLTPDDVNEDWLKSSTRSLAHENYERNNIIFTDGIGYIRDPGHPGYSNNTIVMNIANIAFPLFAGRAQLQADTIDYNAGTLKPYGRYKNTFGTCRVHPDGCSQSSQESTFTNLAFAYDEGPFHIDLGNGPDIDASGFNNQALVGGISYKFSLGNFSLTPEFHRRSKDNSLLAYKGQTDPISGIRWGAVKKTGFTLSGSYYINDDSGLWAFITANELTGRAVEKNRELQFMTGYYYHVINRPNERLTLSPAVMLWGFNKDLSGYTLSQGGYYSPQNYASLSLTLSYKYRTEYYSLLAEVSGALSHSKTHDSNYYQTQNARDSINHSNYLLERLNMSPNYDELSAYSKGSNSVGLGGSIRLALERRINSHLVLGGEIFASHSEDYSPMALMLYFRTYFSPWNGDLPMPPKPPRPATTW